MSAAIWTSSEVLEFIDLYRNQPIIWDPKHPQHKNKNKVNDAWLYIADVINIPVAELKKKKESLMATFRTHNKKKNNSYKSGMGEDEGYTPIWPYYEPLAAFLKDIYECHSVINTEENEVTNTQEKEEEEANKSTAETVLGDTSNKPKMPPTLKRRSKNPPELAEASREVSNAFGTLNRMLDNKNAKVEDDCELYGKLLAAKLRKFEEYEREEIMLDIDAMLLRRRKNKENSLQSEWFRSTPSPYQRPYSSQSNSSTSVQQSPRRSDLAYSSSPTYRHQSPLNRPHSTQRIRIVSNEVFSPSHFTQPSHAQISKVSSPEPELPVIHLPEISSSSSPAYVTIPHQSPLNRPHSTQRIRIVSNKEFSPSHFTKSSHAQIPKVSSPELEPPVIHLPEMSSDIETYINSQSDSMGTQNIIYRAYEDAQNM